MNKPTIHILDLNRFHNMCRLIEDDLDEAYMTCRQKYGYEVAGVLLVALLRQQLNTNKDQWPPPEDLTEKVNKFLADRGLLDDGVYRKVL